MAAEEHWLKHESLETKLKWKELNWILSVIIAHKQLTAISFNSNSVNQTLLWSKARLSVENLMQSAWVDEAYSLHLKALLNDITEAW